MLSRSRTTDKRFYGVEEGIVTSVAQAHQQRGPPHGQARSA